MTVQEEQPDIFSLYDAEGKEERQKQKKKRGMGAQAVREVGLGVTQGALDVGELIGLAQAGISAPATYGLMTPEQRKEVATPGMKARTESLFDPEATESQFAALAADDDELVGPQILPGQRTALREAAEEIPEEGILQESVRRITRSVPGLVGGPATALEMAGRELLGLTAKEGAKALGFGEFAQALADIGGSLTPNLLQKNIVGGTKLLKAAERGAFTTEKQMVDFARRMGMTEEAIAPLVREGKFANVLTKIASSGGATEKALHTAEAAVGRNFQTLRELPKAQIEISGAVQKTFLKDLEKKLYDLPSGSREAIQTDLKQLLDGPVNGDRLMKFWGDINSYFKQHPKLGALKEPIKKALSGVSPELAQDFGMANSLAQRFRDVSKKLKPTLASDLFLASEAIAGVGALVTGNVPLLGKIAGVQAVRKLSEMMLTNPRFMNLSKKMVTTLNAGQIKGAKKVLDQIIGMVQKESPEAASKLQNIDMNELEQILKESE